MSEGLPTTELLRRDPGFRCNDNLTGEMSPDELWNHLTAAATELDAQREFEVSYGIYRELVWRFPHRPEAWAGLATFAEKMGFRDEARTARTEAARLNDQH